MKKIITGWALVLLAGFSFKAAAQPNASFTVNPKKNLCAPAFFQFQSHSSTQNCTHSWDFSNGQANGVANPGRQYVTPGTYKVTHTVTCGGQSATAVEYVVVDPAPVVNFTASPLIGCPPLNVTFTDNSTLNAPGGATYTWVLGGSKGIGTNKNESSTYTAGPQDITLEVKNSKGCVSQLTKKNYVDVYSKPVPTFTAAKTDFCSAPAVTDFFSGVTGGTGTLKYNWSFSSIDPNPKNVSFAGPAPAQYTVKLTVTDANNCSGSVEVPNYIKIHKPSASFTGPTSVCTGSPAQFTSTSTPAPDVYHWDFGDNNYSNSASPGHTYAAPGTYTVKLVVTQGGCKDSIQKQVIVRPQPNVDFYKVPDTLCPAPQTVQFFPKNPNLTGFAWDFGDYNSSNNTSTLGTPTHTYTKNDLYSVTFIGTDNFGCKDTLTKIEFVKIYPLFLVATADKTSGCVPLTVKFESRLLKDTIVPAIYPYAAKTYEWTFHTGAKSSLANPTYTFTDTGRYMVKLKVTTVQGCVVEDSMMIEVGAKPVAAFYASPLVVCNKQTVWFYNQSTGYNPLRYLWKFGDTKESFQKDPNHQYLWPGKYTVTLYTDHYGCIDTEKKVEYIEVLEPGAEFEMQKDCDTPTKVYFTNLSKGDSTRIWYFGDGNTSTQKAPVHKYANPGKYTVMLVVHNPNTTCYDTMKHSIYAGPNPPDVIADKTKICLGDTVNFWAYMTKDTSFAYFDWYIDGLFKEDTVDKYSFVFTTTGLHSVKVISHPPLPDTCSGVVEKTNWILVSKPEPGFIADSTFNCLGDTVKFTDTSKATVTTTIVKRRWHFGASPGDSLITAQTNVSKYYTARGAYDIKLYLTDNIGCTDSAVRPAHVHVLKPAAGFTVPNPLCVWAEIPFTDTSHNAVAWEWNFGDGGTSTDKDPKHPYQAKGTYNATLIAKDSIGCADTVVRSLTAIKPEARFTMTDSVSICPNLIVGFDGTPSINARTYSWNFDNGNAPTNKKQPYAVFNQPNAYNVRLVVFDSVGCTDTAIKKVHVLGYAGSFSYTPKEGCAPFDVNFTSLIQGPVPSVIWDFGDGETKTGSPNNVTHTYKVPGLYTPRMIFNDGLGCKAGSEGVDTIRVDDVVAEFTTGPACEFSMVEFINNSKGVITPIKNYYWKFHDGQFSVLQNPKRTYGAADKYKVLLAVENMQGCKDTVERDLVINEPIEVNAGDDTIKCLNDSVMLVPTGGVSYVWSPATGLSCTTCPNPYASPKVKSTYTVISTDINGCHDTDKIEIGIKTHVTSETTIPRNICEGEIVQLNVSGANTYVWSPGHNLDNPNSPTPNASPTENTKYRVIAYEGSCIPDTNYVDVTVYPRPRVSVRGEKTIVAGNTADLIASGQHIVRFLWSPVSTLSCTDCSDPVASPFKTTTYTVRVFSKYECEDSAKVTVTVLCDESQIFIPNTFTPNGDGMNDVFMIRGAGISSVKSFRIYNRWGEVMFERTAFPVNDKTYGWDGTHNGTVLPPDVYVYTVEAYCENGDLLKWKGDVTILR